MRIAVSAAGPEPVSPAEERFGRCPYFLVFDQNEGLLEVINNNESIGASEGAGIKSTQTLLRHKVGVVLTGRVGPKAMHALSAGGVLVYTGVSGTAVDTLRQYKQGLMSPLTAANNSKGRQSG